MPEEILSHLVLAPHVDRARARGEVGARVLCVRPPLCSTVSLAPPRGHARRLRPATIRLPKVSRRKAICNQVSLSPQDTLYAFLNHIFAVIGYARMRRPFMKTAMGQETRCTDPSCVQTAASSSARWDRFTLTGILRLRTSCRMLNSVTEVLCY